VKVIHPGSYLRKNLLMPDFVCRLIFRLAIVIASTLISCVSNTPLVQTLPPVVGDVPIAKVASNKVGVGIAARIT
jgi:hypothetical protein